MTALLKLFPKTLVATMIAALVLMAMPAIASAAEPTIVRLATCAYVSGGQVTVAPGDVALRAGWSAGTKGLTIAFVKGIDLAASIDGQAIPNPESYWDKPTPQPEKSWGIAWTYDAGTLGPGETMNVSFVMTLRHPLPDLMMFEGHRPVVSPAGTIWDMPCAITAN